MLWFIYTQEDVKTLYTFSWLFQDEISDEILIKQEWLKAERKRIKKNYIKCVGVAYDILLAVLMEQENTAVFQIVILRYFFKFVLTKHGAICVFRLNILHFETQDKLIIIN